MAFAQKFISAQFSNGLEVSGLRMSFHGISGGNNSMAEADLLIFGLPLSKQNSLSTLGWRGQKQNPDSVTVSAGEAGRMAVVYKGTIISCYSDYMGGPAVAMHCTMLAGAREAALTSKPLSVNNRSADVAQLMGQLAQKMGLIYESNGINVKLAYPYLPYDLRTQAMTLARHAGVNWTIERGVLATWPSDGSRGGSISVSPRNNLVGYPAFSNGDVRCKILFDPSQTPQHGGMLNISDSAIVPANGQWVITKIEWSLQAMTPSGEWFVSLQAWDPHKNEGTPGVA